jgi:hypothetical protein
MAQAGQTKGYRPDPVGLEELRKRPLDDETVLEDVRHAGRAAEAVLESLDPRTGRKSCDKIVSKSDRNVGKVTGLGYVFLRRSVRLRQGFGGPS